MEADSLFGLLEQQIVPLFYDRGADGLPHGWVERMRNNWRTLGPQVTAQRMVRDYVNELYEPISARSVRLYSPADRFALGRELTAWKSRVAKGWHQVHIDAVGPSLPASEVGAEMRVTAQVSLGTLTSDDVEVQLLHGPVGEGGQLIDPATVAMHDDGAIDAGHRRYAATFAPGVAGRYGYTARVVTAKGDVSPPLELGLIAWAG
jgi:starch phosphorylase